MGAGQGRGWRMTPQSVARGTRIYHWVTVGAAFPVIGLVLLHAYVLAAVFAGFAALAMCARCLAQGFTEGYQKALQHTTEDANEAAEREIAAKSPCEIVVTGSSLLPGEGFIYAIKFSTGTIKVGQTLDPHRRLGEHRRDAEAYNVAIIRYWVSPAHDNYLDNEIELIGFCDGISARAKREYFHDVDFDSVVKFACGLTYYSAATAGVRS
jgi:hypothetical protein